MINTHQSYDTPGMVGWFTVKFNIDTPLFCVIAATEQKYIYTVTNRCMDCSQYAYVLF